MSASFAARIVTRVAAPSRITRCSRSPNMRMRMGQQTFQPAARSFTVSSQSWVKKYTEDHEWVEVSEDGKTGTIGITHYAANALGDVVFVELPTADLQVAQGDTIGAVESVKSASDIMSPLSGTVIEANNALEEKPLTINQSPEEDGWFAKISIEDSSELDALLSAEQYKAFTEDADSGK